MVDPLLPSNSAAHMPEVRENCEMRNVLASPKPIISKRNKTLLAFQEKQELKSKLAIRGNTSHSVLGSFGFTLHLPSLKSQALNWRIPFLVGRLSVVRNSFCLHICFVALCVFYMFSHWL